MSQFTAKQKRRIYSTRQLRRIQFPVDQIDLATHLQQVGEQNEYTYRIRETGEVVVVVMTLQERQARELHGFITLPDGEEARYTPIEQILHDTGAPPSVADRVRSQATWPMRTTLTGVGEHQVGELREFIAERKLRGVTVNEDGSLTVSGPRAFREYCKATGLYARNAGYSDPQPYNR